MFDFVKGFGFPQQSLFSKALKSATSDDTTPPLEADFNSMYIFVLS